MRCYFRSRPSDLQLPKKIPKTIENTRKRDETTVEADDEEVAGDEAIDEFAEYYAKKQKPKLLITTSNRPKGKDEIFPFIQEMLGVFPNSFYYSRKGFEIKKICASAIEHGFTDLMILHEDHAELNSMLLVLIFIEFPFRHSGMFFALLVGSMYH